MDLASACSHNNASQRFTIAATGANHTLLIACVGRQVAARLTLLLLLLLLQDVESSQTTCRQARAVTFK
jgi:glycosyltransferase A (GT-A) superfamily protein (DUF2064 family)